MAEAMADGAQDVPAGVVAVLSRGDLDILSHVALRARATGTLLASCADAEVLGAFASLEGALVRRRLNCPKTVQPQTPNFPNPTSWLLMRSAAAANDVSHGRAVPRSHCRCGWRYRLAAM